MTIHPYYQGPFYARIDKGLAIAYPLSGAITSFSDYAAFWLFFSALGADLFVATAGAYVIGLTVSYLQNRYWVFRKGASRQSDVASIWRYGAFLLFNLLLTYAMLWVMERHFGITPYLGKFIVGAFMFFWIYVGNTYWVFRGPKIGPIQL